jgi:hypothetical protein
MVEVPELISILKISEDKATGSSETLVTTQQTLRRHNQE